MRFWSLKTHLSISRQGRFFHLYTSGEILAAVLITSELLLVPLPFTLSCPRQRIRQFLLTALASWTIPPRSEHPVDTYSDSTEEPEVVTLFLTFVLHRFRAAHPSGFRWVNASVASKNAGLSSLPFGEAY